MLPVLKTAAIFAEDQEDISGDLAFAGFVLGIWLTADSFRV